MTKKTEALSRSAALRGPVKAEPIEDIGEVWDQKTSVGQEVKDLRKATGVTLNDL